MDQKEVDKLMKEHKEIEEKIDSCIRVLKTIINPDDFPYTFLNVTETKNESLKQYVKLCNTLGLKNKYMV